MTPVAAAGAACAALLAWAAHREGSRSRAARLRPARVSRLVPRRWARWLGVRLDAAGLALDPGTALGAWVGVAVLAAVVGSGASPVLGVLAGASVLVAGPVALATARARARARRTAALPEVLERVASELRSGCTVAEALTSAARSPGPLRRDLAVVGRAIAHGAGIAAALDGWARRSPLDGVREAAGGLVVASRLGGAAAPALDGLAGSLRDRLAAGAEARAQSSQARLSAWVVGGAPVGYLAFASVVDPGSVSPLMSTPAGRLCLVAGLVLEGLGALWIRRIVAVDGG